MRLYYVAHPYGGDRTNLLRAKIWYAWLVENWPHNAYAMNWLVECELLEESVHRELGIARDLEIVRRCDGFIACGPRFSEGMQSEWSAFESVHPGAARVDCLARMPAEIGTMALALIEGALS